MNATQSLAPATTRGDRRPGAEGRRRGRIACDLPAACHPLAAGPEYGLFWYGKVRDVSAGGLGLVLGRRFEVGTVLVVEVGGLAPRPPKSLIARVAHTQALGEHRWLVGCAFLSRLSAEKLQAVLCCARPEPAVAVGETTAPLESPSAHLAIEGSSLLTPGGRGDSTCCILRGVLFEAVGAGAGRASLLVRQVHLRGAWPLPEGATLLMRLNDLPRGAAGLRLKVRECCQRGQRRVVRCEFVGTPPAEVLCKFGQASP
jgi:hypothetical protein